MSGRPVRTIRKTFTDPASGQTVDVDVVVVTDIKAQLPSCPTCKGTEKGAEGINGVGEKAWAHCTNCKDGKTTIEQMAELWELVYGPSALGIHLRQLLADNGRLHAVKQ